MNLFEQWMIYRFVKNRIVNRALDMELDEHQHHHESEPYSPYVPPVIGATERSVADYISGIVDAPRQPRFAVTYSVARAALLSGTRLGDLDKFMSPYDHSDKVLADLHRRFQF